LCRVQSLKTVGAYIFAASGAGESTTDLAWDGQLTVHELGVKLAESERFANDDTRAFADIDLERIEQDRLRLATFRDSALAAGERVRAFR
ncbi:NAD(+) synthase, partial [bacterium LRH843]|nr:NAD(+) synthase [bacterium LRH843]